MPTESSTLALLAGVRQSPDRAHGEERHRRAKNARPARTLRRCQGRSGRAASGGRWPPAEACPGLPLETVCSSMCSLPGPSMRTAAAAQSTALPGALSARYGCRRCTSSASRPMRYPATLLAGHRHAPRRLRMTVRLRLAPVLLTPARGHRPARRRAQRGAQQPRPARGHPGRPAERAAQEAHPTQIIDVRSRPEYLETSHQGARSRSPRHPRDPGREVSRQGLVVVYCACPHHLASLAYGKLQGMGYRNVKVLDEGLPGWVRRGCRQKAPRRRDPAHAAWGRDLPRRQGGAPASRNTQ